MPLQNRILPTGDITAQPFRGTLMGNRGILHGDHKTLKTARWTHQAWVTCVLKYKNWHRPIMTPHNYTELFFLDECAALAAGHRPCGLCRRADYNRFRSHWDAAHGPATSIKDVDRTMHRYRVTRDRHHIRYQADITTLPDGVFIQHNATPHLVWQNHLLRYATSQYDQALPRPTSGKVNVLTPTCTVAVLSQGYTPTIHATASALLRG